MDWRNWALPAALVASAIVMIVPMPSALIDLLLVASIALSVIILLTTLHVRSPLEFSLFPAVLLVATLCRLVLNISTTRLILSEGHRGMDSAGMIIQSFGNFVIGEHLVVGLIIFGIIAVVQFVVVTQGATRVSEVAARFALDGLPGRQMAIDADLAAGQIDQPEASRRREALLAQADFYGAMDGASKFVRGDAIAGVLITLINIFGGLALGLSQGMSLQGAAATFTRLTIGDGLASQLPAFLIALSAGILMTRSSLPTNLPALFLQQLFGQRLVMLMACVFLAALVFTRLPALPLLAIAAVCGGIFWGLSAHQRGAGNSPATGQAIPSDQDEIERRLEALLQVDPLEIEVGVNLIALADAKVGGDLLPQIVAIRQEITAQLGMILPKVRVRDNLALEQNAYCLKINNAVVDQGVVFPGRILARASDSRSPLPRELEGIPSDPFHPALGVWVTEDQVEYAVALGCDCRPAADVLADRLRAAAIKHADQLLNREATRYLVDQVRKYSPTLVEELIPSQLKLSDVQQVLQMLLREGVSIRRLALILETLGDYAGRIKDLVWLTECVRQRLAPHLCQTYCDAGGVLRVAYLPSEWEESIAARLEEFGEGAEAKFGPREIAEIQAVIAAQLQPLVAEGYPPILLVGRRIRPSVKMLTYATLPDLIVLSQNELTPDVRVETVGQTQRAA